MVTTEQIKALEERQTALHTHLHIDDRRLELDEPESLTHAPDYWDDPGNAEWYRLEAFESCPGLIELWPQPFQAKYQAADGAVLIRFRNGPDGGIQMAADVTDK